VKVIGNLTKDAIIRALVSEGSSDTEAVGSESVFESATSNYVVPVYDSNENKTVFFYLDGGNSSYATAIVSTLSGTSLSYGSPVVFNNAPSYYMRAAFDSNSNKIVVVYQDDNSGPGKAIVGTVSGTSISFGTEVTFNASVTTRTSIVFDSNSNKVVITYRDHGNSGYGTGIVGTVSGTSISFGSPTVFESGTVDYVNPCFDSNLNKVVVAYQDGGDSNKGKAIVGTVDSSDNSISFGSAAEFAASIGIGDPDIVAITFDSNANKVVIVYKDGSNSGHAIVGTVSGTSVSFGTAASFNGSDNVGNLGCTFDSSNNKVVITYHDAGNSYHGTAVVGTVSGTDITFGSEAVFNSATTYEIGVTFDSSNNKVAIFYKDAGNSEHGYGKVGTVSGTDITYGSATEFNDAVTSYIFAGFDSSNNKVIVAYQDSHDGSGGRAKVATISGTSISFGSEATFNSGATLHPQVAFDSNVNKVIIMYEDDANSDYGTYAVGTVSGTSISFGSEIVFEAAAVEDLGIAFDSNANRMVMVYQDQGNSSHGTAIIQQSANDLSGALSANVVTAGTALSATKLLVKG